MSRGGLQRIVGRQQAGLLRSGGAAPSPCRWNGLVDQARTASSDSPGRPPAAGTGAQRRERHVQAPVAHRTARGREQAPALGARLGGGFARLKLRAARQAHRTVSPPDCAAIRRRACER